MSLVIGAGGIYAKVVADSVSDTSPRLTTFEVKYPRFIHSELMTHRVFSRNAASSRAIPVGKMADQLTATPIFWGSNQSGMQAGKELSNEALKKAKDIWERARLNARMAADELHALGLHKQHTNRLTEPFCMIKVLITATEFNNFFWLRDHEAAQPEIKELARVMYEARELSGPFYLEAGEWHLPYVERHWEATGEPEYYIFAGEGIIQKLTLEEALKVSAARCAAVSFRNVDYTLEKSLEVYERLLGADRKHASAFEHQATPADNEFGEIYTKHGTDFQKGVTHHTTNGQAWSGNLKGWVQHRQLIPGHYKKG